MSSGTSEMSRLAKWALFYKRQGWDVLPVHGVRPTPSGDRCTCGAWDCTNPGKHPATSGWNTTPTSALELELRYRDEPSTNIGIHCDRMLVVDLDGVEGIRNFRNLRIREGTPSPVTPTVKTGGGGYHLYFQPVEGAKNSVALLPKVDIRARGGYVIAPPSRTAKGGYSWVEGREPWSIPLAKPPNWLVERVKPRPLPKACTTPRDPWEVSETDVEHIHEGSRHGRMASLCGRVMTARTGAGRVSVDAAMDTVVEDLLRLNSLRFHPPLPAKEVRRIARNIARLRKRAA